MVKQLPPITEGGAAWLRKLRALTEGEELGIGDFRVIGAKCRLGGGLADVEEIANTTRDANDVPYSVVENALTQYVRNIRPPMPVLYQK